MKRTISSSLMCLIWIASCWITALSSSLPIPDTDLAIAQEELGIPDTDTAIDQEELGRAGTNARLCSMLRDAVDPDLVFCDLKAYKFDFGNPTCNSLGPSVSVVVRPNTAKEVAAVILVARDTNTPLSVRGGGHSYSCNAVKANSIHIDLRSLNSKAMVDNDIDEEPYPGEEKLLKFGGGTRFVDIFEIVNRDEYSFVHGDCYTVGVGGYYLHGGLHLPSLTKRYGYGNETIRSLELVMADGEILRFKEARTRLLPNIPGEPYRYNRSPVQVYNENDELVEGYADLWDAVRVAGSSFAVITEITVQVWAEREPYLWFLSIDLSTAEKLTLFFDAAEDPNVQLNLYFSFGLTNLIQMSLLDGPLDEKANREVCMQWLDGWFDRNGNKLWRLTRFQALITTGFDILGVQGGRTDLGALYLIPSYILTGVLVPWGAPHRNDIMRYIIEEFSSSPVALVSCILGIATVSSQNVFNGERLVFLEYNCGPVKIQQDRMREISRHFNDAWPGETFRHYNIPTDMGNDAENEELVELYFPDLALLQQSKNQYDPDNVISAFQGITPA